MAFDGTTYTNHTDILDRWLLIYIWLIRIRKGIIGGVHNKLNQAGFSQYAPLLMPITHNGWCRSLVAQTCVLFIMRGWLTLVESIWMGRSMALLRSISVRWRGLMDWIVVHGLPHHRSTVTYYITIALNT